MVKKLIDQYIEHYGDGEWHRESYPHIILHTNNASLRRRVDEYVESLIENGYIDDDEVNIRITELLTSDLIFV